MAPRAETEARCCVACDGGSEAGAALVRWFVDPSGGLWPDWTGSSRKLGGRGANVHASVDCVAVALRKGGFARSLRTRVAPVTDATLVTRLLEAGESAWFQRLGLGLRAGLVAAGALSADEAFAGATGGLLILASDARGASRRSLSEQARRHRADTLEVRDGAWLGAALGREFVAVAYVRRSVFSTELLSWGRALANLPGSRILAPGMPELPLAEGIDNPLGSQPATFAASADRPKTG